MRFERFALAVLAALSFAAVAQPEASKKPAVECDFGGDHFAAGGSVRIDKPVAGDLIAAGSPWCALDAQPVRQPVDRERAGEGRAEHDRDIAPREGHPP